MTELEPDQENGRSRKFWFAVVLTAAVGGFCYVAIVGAAMDSAARAIGLKATRTVTATATHTPSATPTQTATPTPTATQTPLPTNTPAPTSTREQCNDIELGVWAVRIGSVMEQLTEDASRASSPQYLVENYLELYSNALDYKTTALQQDPPPCAQRSHDHVERALDHYIAALEAFADNDVETMNSEMEQAIILLNELPALLEEITEEQSD